MREGEKEREIGGGFFVGRRLKRVQFCICVLYERERERKGGRYACSF